MRVRLTVLGCALTALACAVFPSVAGAHPVFDRGLTIHATPQHISAGDPVLIYGRLLRPDRANQTIRLYHRIAPAPYFTLVQSTTTHSGGLYWFTRADGIVLTNRNWFVRGPGFTHSRTVHERVAAVVSLNPGGASGLTRHPITFTGQVTPDHTGGVILLQQQRGDGDHWHTIARARIGAGSAFSVSYAWRVPGSYEVRAVLPADPRNLSTPSDPVPVVVQQTEVPDFTISTSDPIVTSGQSATISGTLYEAGTTMPESSTTVGLFEATPGTHAFKEVTTTVTGPGGSYSFQNISSTVNELYQVRTMFAPRRHSAIVFEGAQDTVTMTASASSSAVDGHVTLTGIVSPDKAGHVIYLQKLSRNGDWETVEVRFVTASSTFHFGWTFGAPGTKTFRARITGGRVNVGGASSPVGIDVSLPPLTSLPTG
ncbi:MAG: hypothetical protein ACRDL5_08450 [Solirubrobacteraceae bacterium]